MFTTEVAVDVVVIGVDVVVVEVVVDWVAMSYKFKGDPRSFYEKTKPSMGDNITNEFHEFISKQFDHLELYRNQNKRA